MTPSNVKLWVIVACGFGLGIAEFGHATALLGVIVALLALAILKLRKELHD